MSEQLPTNLLAVFLANVGAAAVAAIIGTATVVVAVVTVPVTLVIWIPAFPRALALVLGIEALASFAVICLDRSALDCLCTAIAAVIITATVVIFIVAVAVGLVLWISTRALTVRVGFWFVFRIEALAGFAVTCLDCSALDRLFTAVATVVTTATVVVGIVAVAVALVLGVDTCTFAVRVDFSFVFGIEALTGFAVSFLDYPALN